MNANESGWWWEIEMKNEMKGRMTIRKAQEENWEAAAGRLKALVDLAELIETKRSQSQHNTLLTVT